jgi:translation initiation factor 1
MAKNKISSLGGLVYSTNPNVALDDDNKPAEAETLPPKEQNLLVRLETKHRGGKTVTLILNFVGTTADLEDLGKKLKTHCGTGGSVKDGEIIIQGDNREKAKQWLNKQFYKYKG